MDKYQEALNCIYSFLSHVRGRGIGKSNAFIKLSESGNTLQELIDNMKFIEEVQTPDYIRVQKENEKLEKALDKACEILETHYITHYETNYNESVVIKSHKNWKEYLLKEGEKQ